MRPEASGAPIPTFAGDTIVRVPKGAGDDRALILKTSRRIAEAYLRFKDLPDAERRSAIAQELAPLSVA